MLLHFFALKNFLYPIRIYVMHQQSSIRRDVARRYVPVNVWFIQDEWTFLYLTWVRSSVFVFRCR
jgi:hypothetical protein